MRLQRSRAAPRRPSSIPAFPPLPLPCFLRIASCLPFLPSHTAARLHWQVVRDPQDQEVLCRASILLVRPFRPDDMRLSSLNHLLLPCEALILRHPRTRVSSCDCSTTPCIPVCHPLLPRDPRVCLRHRDPIPSDFVSGNFPFVHPRDLLHPFHALSSLPFALSSSIRAERALRRRRADRSSGLLARLQTFSFLCMAKHCQLLTARHARKRTLSCAHPLRPHPPLRDCKNCTAAYRRVPVCARHNGRNAVRTIREPAAARDPKGRAT